VNFMAASQRLNFAFVVSLVGSLIVLIASLVNFIWFLSGEANFGGFGNFMRGAMSGYHSFMGSYGSSNSFLAEISVVSLVCGVIILIGATMLKVDPHKSTMWAIIIIVFSVISFVGMGGYFIGAVLAVVGGAFVLSTKQTNP
jgi:Family of unknown function (DUF6114)